jgi:hypothetical protein
MSRRSWFVVFIFLAIDPASQACQLVRNVEGSQRLPYVSVCSRSCIRLRGHFEILRGARRRELRVPFVGCKLTISCKWRSLKKRRRAVLGDPARRTERVPEEVDRSTSTYAEVLPASCRFLFADFVILRGSSPLALSYSRPGRCEVQAPAGMRPTTPRRCRRRPAARD